MRSRLLALVLVLPPLIAWPAVSAPAQTAAEAGRRPNIVYILADDLGVGDLACLNPEGKIATPNLDRLAAEGMAFTDAHSASAVCTPTRYGILTGRYAWRTRLQARVLDTYSPPLIAAERVTVASLLKDRGYATACIGKWHLGWEWPTRDGEPPIAAGAREGANIDYSRPIRRGPRSAGFDYFFGIPASLDMGPYVYVENDRVLTPPTERVEAGRGQAFHRAGPASKEFSHTAVLPRLTRKAVEYIEARAASDEDRPFFLYFPLTAPHAPIVPAAYFRGKSKLGAYGDFVHQVDWTVGRIMEALRKGGLAENTLLVFTADNGCAGGAGFAALARRGHHPSFAYRGKKKDIFEGGHRVPFLARWPGRVTAEATCSTPVCLNDLLATVADIVGAKLPETAGEDSRSMLPDLLGEPRSEPSGAIVHHATDGTFAVRSGRWKLVLGPGSGGDTEPRTLKGMRLGLPRVQLYDLECDIGERTNLHAEHPDVVRRLTALLRGYVERGRSTPGAPQKNDVRPVIDKAAALPASAYTLVPVEHAARGKPVTTANAAPVKYSAAGLAALTDGTRATTSFRDGHWVGVQGRDLDVTVDLGEVRRVHHVRVGFLQDQNVWIFRPLAVELAISRDGKAFTRIDSMTLGAPEASSIVAVHEVGFDFRAVKARWLRVTAKNVATCPAWHKGDGGTCWVFADEIIVR